MQIYEVRDKRKYMPLLLIGDEQVNMIEKYLDGSTMFILDDGGVKGEITVLEADENTLEIKNLAIYPEYRKMGYGRALIEFVARRYTPEYARLSVGTGDSTLTVPFYEKCGFTRSHRIKNFFLENYDRPIIEDGVQLKDMIYLIRKLT